MFATSTLPQTPSFRKRTGARQHVRFNCLVWLIHSLEMAPLVNVPWSRVCQVSELAVLLY